MSAFMCPPEHFGLLAAFACRPAGAVTARGATPDDVIAQWRVPTRQATAMRIARELALENIRSLAYRYEDGTDTEENRATIEEAQIWAAHYLAWWPATVTAARVLGHAHCYAYQACESDDWDATLAYQQIERIVAACGPIERAPGCWEWTDRATRQAVG